MIVANARMYSVNAATTEAWRALLEWVIAEAGVDGEVIDYPPPRPLPELWARDDLGCAFMCGFPLVHAARTPVVLAAPVPAPERYAGRAVYWTDIVARSDGPVRTLADALGHRFAYTSVESQSGYQAPRALLASYARERGAPLFRATVGPLVTPRRVVEAVLAGDADAGPVDSYALDLMRVHEPAWVAPLVVIASTEPTPIPPLVGGAGLPSADATRLTRALAAVADAAALAPAREALLLRGFTAARAADYDGLRDRARAADAQGYPELR